jgi:hypothetical protein
MSSEKMKMILGFSEALLGRSGRAINGVMRSMSAFFI